jgi:hypothetical protein
MPSDRCYRVTAAVADDYHVLPLPSLIQGFFSQRALLAHNDAVRLGILIDTWVFRARRVMIMLVMGGTALWAEFINDRVLD